MPQIQHAIAPLHSSMCSINSLHACSSTEYPNTWTSTSPQPNTDSVKLDPLVTQSTYLEEFRNSSRQLIPHYICFSSTGPWPLTNFRTLDSYQLLPDSDYRSNISTLSKTSTPTLLLKLKKPTRAPPPTPRDQAYARAAHSPHIFLSFSSRSL